jgi:hypothetical protein
VSCTVCASSEYYCDIANEFFLSGRHGNLIANANANNYQCVPFSTWRLIKDVFPEAIEHKIFLQSDDLLGCLHCHEEGVAKNCARSNIADLAKFSRETQSSRALSVESILEMSKSLSCKRFHLVHRGEIALWHRFLSVFTRKDGVKRDGSLKEIAEHFFLTCAPDCTPMSMAFYSDNCNISVDDRNRLEFLARMFGPITCREHGRAIRDVLFQSRDRRAPRAPLKLDDCIYVLDEKSYDDYITNVGAASVMLFPSDNDQVLRGATLQDFLSEGAYLFDRMQVHGFFHPTCVPVHANENFDTKDDNDNEEEIPDRFFVSNDQMAILLRLTEPSCSNDSCRQCYKKWHTQVTESEKESSIKKSLTCKGVADDPIDIDNEPEQVSMSTSDIVIKIFDVSEDAKFDSVLPLLTSRSGMQVNNECENDQLFLRRSSRKRTSRYPVGDVLDEETVHAKWDINIAALRLLLLERCTKGTLFALDHTLAFVVEQSKPRKKEEFISVLVNSEDNNTLSTTKLVSCPKIIDLPFDVNCKTIREIFEESIDFPFDASMPILLVRQPNVEKTASSIPNDELMGHLFCLASATTEVVADPSNDSKRSKRARTEKGFTGTFLSSTDAVKPVTTAGALDIESSTRDDVPDIVHHHESNQAKPLHDNASISTDTANSNIEPNTRNGSNRDVISTNTKDDSQTSKYFSRPGTDLVNNNHEKLKSTPIKSDDSTRDCFEDDSDDDIELLLHRPFAEKKATTTQQHALGNKKLNTASIAPGMCDQMQAKKLFLQPTKYEHAASQMLIAAIVQMLLSNPDIRSKNEEICRMAAENVVEMHPDSKNADDLYESAYSVYLELTLP